MRILISFFITLFSVAAMASGKLTFQNNFQNGGEEYRPQFGLSIYEPLTKHLAANIWTGYGQQFVDIDTDVDWWVSKGQIDFIFGKFVVAPGVQYKVLMTDESDISEDVTTFFVRFDYKLW